jgi:hypothetical protein
MTELGEKRQLSTKASLALEKNQLGMDITSDRIAILNKMFDIEASMELIDLYDDSHEACGTKVLISIPVITKETYYD